VYEGKEQTGDECISIEADLLADEMRANARGTYGARQNLAPWPVGKATLFIQISKGTSGMKQQLAPQCSDGKLKGYTIERETCTIWTVDNVAWQVNETAFKRLSKNKQVNISKAWGIMEGRNLAACVTRKKKIWYTYWRVRWSTHAWMGENHGQMHKKQWHTINNKTNYVLQWRKAFMDIHPT
jgi:hypothetical protein